MKILLVGAGAVSSVISYYLSKNPDVSKIICGSRDVKRAKQFVSTNRKVSIIKLDASNSGQISKAAKGVNLIINASSPKLNETLMKAALDANSNYQDLCSDLADLRNPEQLKFDKQFKKQKLVGLINTGISPGITNLVAKESSEKFDSVESISIRLIEDQKSSEMVFSWSPEVALDELTSMPLVYKNGAFTLSKPFAGTEKYQFPQPFGEKHVVNIYGDEVSTIPRYIKTKHVDYKSSGTDIEFSKALYKLGFFNKKPLLVNGQKVSPVELFSRLAPQVPTPKQMSEMIKNGTIENAVCVMSVETIGLQAGKKIKLRSTVVLPDLLTISKKFPGATYISYPTGLAAASFTSVIPKITSYGVYPPEALEKDIRKHVMIKLESNGITMDETFSGI